MTREIASKRSFIGCPPRPCSPPPTPPAASRARACAPRRCRSRSLASSPCRPCWTSPARLSLPQPVDPSRVIRRQILPPSPLPAIDSCYPSGDVEEHESYLTCDDGRGAGCKPHHEGSERDDGAVYRRGKAITQP